MFFRLMKVGIPFFSSKSARMRSHRPNGEYLKTFPSTICDHTAFLPSGVKAGPVNPSGVPGTPDLKSVRRYHCSPSGETAYMLVHIPFWSWPSRYCLLHPRIGGGEYLSRSTARKIHRPDGCQWGCILKRLRLGPFGRSSQVRQVMPGFPSL